MKDDDEQDFNKLSLLWMRMKQQIDSGQTKTFQENNLANSQLSVQQAQYNPKKQSIQIQKQQEEIFQKSTRLIEYQQKINELEELNNKLNSELISIKQEKSLLLSKFEMLEEIIDTFQHEKSSSRLVRLENDQLKQNIIRLLTLLKQTKEFNGIQIDNNQSFVNFEQTASKSKISELNANQKVDIRISEEIFWIPKKVIDIINEIEMNSNQKNELLISLNQTYFEFYQSRLKKQKQLSDAELNNLKRQLNSRISYDGIMTQKKTERNLKVQFSDQKTETKSKLHTSSKDFFTKVDNQIQITKVVDKSQIFMDGALWLLERIQNEIHSYELGIQVLNKELSQKIDQFIQDEDLGQKLIVNKVFKWITDASDEQLIGLKDSINSILEKTQSKATTRRTFQQTENNNSHF